MLLLEPDPIRAPVVRTIFEWYATADLSLGEISQRLNSDPQRFPPPIPPDPRRARGYWSRSSVWEILHNPKYTGYQVWNRRGQKVKKNRMNPAESWVWSEEQAHEPLVSKEVFEKAAGKGKSRANAGRIEAGSSRADSGNSGTGELLILRSFVRCGICSLRMQGHRNRGSHNYSCEPHRRPPGLIPDGHPSTVYLSEAKAVDKIVYFLNTHIFGSDRIPRLEELLDSSDPESSEAEKELTILKADVTAIDAKIRRQLGHLEAEDAAIPRPWLLGTVFGSWRI